MVWVKCATSAECKTIRIAESSDMDSWKAVLRPMCKVLVISKMEILLVSYQRIEMRRKEGEGFTTGRDPTGGVFEEKLSLLKTSFKNALSLSIKICRYLFFKKKMFLQNKRTTFEPPTILLCIHPSNN